MEEEETSEDQDNKKLIRIPDTAHLEYIEISEGLLPLAEKYQVKAVVAVVQEFTEADNGLHMNEQEVRELDASGLISLQSHGVTHTNMGELLRDEQDMELRESALWLTRFLKKEPIVFVYPIGGSTPLTQELLVQY